MADKLQQQKDALKVLEHVCANFVGNIKDHETVQLSLNVFRQIVIDNEPKKEAEHKE
jgi:hypothetical protein